MKKALILTVGTGDIDNLEESLLNPLKKSIHKGEWAKVVFLPSQHTKSNASALESIIRNLPIEIAPLPKSKMEEDADACFHHFDGVICGLLAEGFPIENIVADFTRGTKAMSAAMVLAAVRRGITTLRYITGPRDNCGSVLPGQEEIKEVNPQLALASARLETAMSFISRGSFSAAYELLPDPENKFATLYWPEPLMRQMSHIRSIALFYTKWDKFDYKGAFEIIRDQLKAWNETKRHLPTWKRYMPTKEMLKWTQTLAEHINKGHKEKPLVLRRVADDILANAERRIRDGLMEDAAVRVYRIRELVAQIRLFEHGIDSKDIPESLPALAKVKDKLKKYNRSWPPGEGGKYQASREKAAMLLQELGDPLAKTLLEEPKTGLLASKSRNSSLLIHGFRTMGDVEKKDLAKDLEQAESLLLKDDPDHARDNLKKARAINFGVNP